MNALVPNLEEAANVASEFIYSLDNLPGEVAHLLQEIKYREARTQELQNEIDKDAAKYIKHSRRASSTSTPMPTTTSSTPYATPLPESPSNSTSRADSTAPNGTPISIPAKITASYTEIHELAAEKCALAERIIEIITRTRAKLDVDIAKVRLLQGDPPELVAAQTSAIANMKPAGLIAAATVPLIPTGVAFGAVGSVGSESFGAPGRNPALAISESLRNAFAIQPLADGARGTALASASGAATPTASTAHANKKRRTTTTTSIKISPAASPTKHRSLSPSAAASAAPVAHTIQKSRLSRQIHPPPPPPDDMDMDAEGDEEEGEMEEENEDETLYCFCRKQSYGDMIACDNEGGCPYEWFHLACVGLKQPTPEKWFCSVCSKDKGLAPTTNSNTRKGRKK